MMYSGDEDFGDEITSGLDLREWPCNDCGAACPYGDELCESCYRKLQAEEDWEAVHPESRCPPRE